MIAGPLYCLQAAASPPRAARSDGQLLRGGLAGVLAGLLRARRAGAERRDGWAGAGKRAKPFADAYPALRSARGEAGNVQGRLQGRPLASAGNGSDLTGSRARPLRLYNRSPRLRPAFADSSLSHASILPIACNPGSTMSGEDTHHHVPKHPIAPRLKNGHKKPHIDHHDTYRCRAVL